MLTHALREIFHTNLAVQKGEKILVFTDKPGREEHVSEHDIRRWERLNDIALLMEETGRGFTKNVVFDIYRSRGGHGVEPPESTWKLAFGEKTVVKLEEKKLLRSILSKKASQETLEAAGAIIKRYRESAVDAVIALSNYSTSHTRFRDFLTGLCGTRYASMPLFDITMFEGAMSVDWKTLAKRTKTIARTVGMAEQVRIETPNGTNIMFSRKGRQVFCDTGILNKPGAFGNLPAGEVFFAPLEGTAHGKMVIDWAPTHKLDTPVTLLIRDGAVVEVTGDDPFADTISLKLEERVENRNIAELGIGTNDRASRPDNILESEKILGTIHIALGDNSSFGGKVKTPFHQDFVFFRPTVMLIHRGGSKTQLMKKGKLVLP